MSSRLPTWHTYARRVHRTHACVATNRLLTANILKSIAPIRTRKRDFLVHLQLCHFNKRSNRSFCNCLRRGRHCSEKNGKHSQWAAYGKSTDWGYLLCYVLQSNCTTNSPYYCGWKSNRTNYKNKHTDTSSNHTTYTTSKKPICYKLYQILIHATKIIISCVSQHVCFSLLH